MSESRVISAWAVCDKCLVSIEVKAHPDHERKSLPPESDWESPLTCPVCGDWLTTDEVVTSE